MEDLPDLPTVEDLNERIQQAEVRGDAGVMIALVMQRQELLDSQREIVEPEPVDQSYADPLAAAVAARLKLDKNRSRRLLGQLPNQEEV